MEEPSDQMTGQFNIFGSRGLQLEILKEQWKESHNGEYLYPNTIHKVG